MTKAGLRVETDLRNEKIGFKIREAQMHKTPYMLIIGDKEAENGTVSVRSRTGENFGAMDAKTLIKNLLKENNEKALERNWEA